MGKYLENMRKYSKKILKNLRKYSEKYEKI